MSPVERTIKPDPDPTLLTTESLLREVAHLKELVEEQISSLRDRTQLQFDLVERQRVEQKNDTKAAVDAALTAQKEAVKEQTTASERAIAKSESGTSKQLEDLAANFRTENTGIRTTIDDLKERVSELASLRAGALEQRTEGRSNSALYVSAVAAGIFAIGLIVSVVALILKP